MPKPFGSMRMTTKSEFLFGALVLFLSLIARSVALSMPVGVLRDVADMLSVVMLIGGVIVVVVGLWHAARRAENPTPLSGLSSPGWFPDLNEATVLRYWDGHAWTGETARRDPVRVQP